MQIATIWLLCQIRIADLLCVLITVDCIFLIINSVADIAFPDIFHGLLINQVCIFVSQIFDNVLQNWAYFLIKLHLHIILLFIIRCPLLHLWWLKNFRGIFSSRSFRWICYHIWYHEWLNLRRKPIFDRVRTKLKHKGISTFLISIEVIYQRLVFFFVEAEKRLRAQLFWFHKMMAL